MIDLIFVSVFALIIVIVAHIILVMTEPKE